MLGDRREKSRRLRQCPISAHVTENGPLRKKQSKAQRLERAKSKAEESLLKLLTIKKKEKQPRNKPKAVVEKQGEKQPKSKPKIGV